MNLVKIKNLNFCIEKEDERDAADCPKYYCFKNNLIFIEKEIRDEKGFGKHLNKHFIFIDLDIIEIYIKAYN